MSEKKDIYFRRGFPLTAQKLTEADYVSVARWCQGKPISDFGKFGLSIRGDGGPIKVWIGDWIVKNPATGKYFVMDEPRFDRYFENRSSQKMPIGRSVKNEKTIDQTWDDDHVYVRLEGFYGETGVTAKDYLTREARKSLHVLMTRSSIMTPNEIKEEIINHIALVKLSGKSHSIMIDGGVLSVNIRAKDVKGFRKYMLEETQPKDEEPLEHRLVLDYSECIIEELSPKNQSTTNTKED